MIDQVSNFHFGADSSLIGNLMSSALAISDLDTYVSTSRVTTLPQESFGTGSHSTARGQLCVHVCAKLLLPP
jgi:hypothetical protein